MGRTPLQRLPRHQLAWREAVEAGLDTHEPHARVLLCGRHGRAAGGPPHFIYAAFNMYHEPLVFELPVLPKGFAWFRKMDTSLPEPDDICRSTRK